MSTATQTNHISSEPRKMDEQPVKPQKPMSIDEYLKALRKEAEVSRLRATIAESMFKENLAMMQLNQLRAGNMSVGPRPNEDKDTPNESPETTEVD